MLRVRQWSNLVFASAAVRFVRFVLVLGLLSATPSAATDGPVAYYPFDGDSNDESGFGNHAVSTGAVLTEDRFGTPNSAYLVGSIGFLEAPDSTSLDITDAFTISAWFRQDDVISTFGILAGKGFNTAYSISVYYGESYVCPDPTAERGIQVSIAGATTRFSAPFFDCGTGEWHHVTVTVAAGNGGNHPISLYVDGSFVETIFMGGLPTNNTAPLGIGRDGENNYFFAGAIDELRLYDRELSRSEAVGLYEPHVFSDGFESGTTSQWSATAP
jgi:hypothetical protein